MGLSRAWPAVVVVLVVGAVTSLVWTSVSEVRDAPAVEPVAVSEKGQSSGLSRVGAYEAPIQRELIASGQPAPQPAPDLDPVVAQHLTKAPPELQRMALEQAEREARQLARKLEASFLEPSGEGQLTSILLLRQLRLREISQVKLREGAGLLLVDNLEFRSVTAGKMAIKYHALMQKQEHQLSVLVVLDEPDHQIQNLTDSLEELKDFLVKERVPVFNRLPEEQRKHAMVAWQERQSPLPGFSKGLMYEIYDLIEFDESAFLWYKRSR